MIKKYFLAVVALVFLSSLVLASEVSGAIVLPSWVAWIIGIALVPIVGHVFWVSIKLGKIDDLNETIGELREVMGSLDQYIRIRDQLLDKIKPNEP